MRVFVVIALALAIGLATAASPFASSSPDGLERVAADKAFDGAAEAPQASPIADYAFPGIEDERLATGLAGFAGTLIVFAAGHGIARTARRIT
jgi:PDGLE domain